LKKIGTKKHFEEWRGRRRAWNANASAEGLKNSKRKCTVCE